MSITNLIKKKSDQCEKKCKIIEMLKHSFQFRVALFIKRCLIEIEQLKSVNLQIAFIKDSFDF